MNIDAPDTCPVCAIGVRAVSVVNGLGHVEYRCGMHVVVPGGEWCANHPCGNAQAAATRYLAQAGVWARVIGDVYRVLAGDADGSRIAEALALIRVRVSAEELAVPPFASGEGVAIAGAAVPGTNEPAVEPAVPKTDHCAYGDARCQVAPPSFRFRHWEERSGAAGAGYRRAIVWFPQGRPMPRVGDRTLVDGCAYRVIAVQVTSAAGSDGVLGGYVDLEPA